MMNCSYKKQQQLKTNTTKLNKEQKDKSKYILKGEWLIQRYIPYTEIKDIGENNIQFVRIEYKINGIKQKNKENHKKVNVQINNNIQTINKQIFRQDVSIENSREKFFIGSQKNKIINLNDKLTEIEAEIIFNDVCLEDRAVGPMQLEVIYGHLNKKTISQLEEFQNLKNLFRNKLISLSDQTIEKIQIFRQKNKKKLKIADSFENGHQPVLIKITKDCENQILQENQTFTIGFHPQLIVKRIFYKLEHFFLKYSTKKNVSKIAQVFDALQSLQAIVQFSGIDVGLAELFKLVQERNINLYDYNQRFSDDNLMFYNKLQSILDKKCILLNVQRDQNQIENFMLVADQKQKFSIGRMEYSDILFSSTQVSRAHGQISYLEDKNQWIIQDGMLNSKDEWSHSTFGTWLEMNIHQEYYIDSCQSVKIGNSQILKFNIENNENDLNLLENSEENEYEKYQTQKYMDTDKLIEQILEL